MGRDLVDTDNYGKRAHWHSLFSQQWKIHSKCCIILHSSIKPFIETVYGWVCVCVSEWECVCDVCGWVGCGLFLISCYQLQHTLDNWQWNVCYTVVVDVVALPVCDLYSTHDWILSKLWRDFFLIIAIDLEFHGHTGLYRELHVPYVVCIQMTFKGGYVIFQ